MPIRTNRIVMVVLVVMIASLAGGVGGSSRSPSSVPTATTDSVDTSSARTSAGRPIGVNDPLRPVAEFWSLQDPAAKADLDRRLAASDIQFLIATVPDPIDSRFGYRFDSILDDIQMAIESQGWNLDRFWLPWRPSGEQPNDRDALEAIVPTSTSGGNAGRSPNSAPTLPLHRREPGVLLFRKHSEAKTADDRQQLLMLLVVGETPTEGLHKVAFRKSLDLVDKYQQVDHPIVEDLRILGMTNLISLNLVGPIDEVLRRIIPMRVRIVGPTFTGTEVSMSYVIREWSHSGLRKPLSLEPLEILVVSGSASKLDARQFANDCGEEPGRLDIRFRATVHHSDLVVKRLLDYLHDLNGGNPLGRIALLTESDTQFGQSTSEFDRFGYDVTDMKFPFHISQVAVAYDQSARASSQSQMALIRPSNKLNIPFDETGHPRDIVPSLSPRMTAATDEFVMSKILETIATEDYRYVGIVATDTRDVIFLSGLIREYAPDVQIFTIYGDMLLGHPEYAGQLRGLLMASTYPLFSLAQRWDPPYSGDRRRHLFSQEGSQG
ncbi:MAG TPA: hypothetical protein VFT74_15120, partial [Isosphaeraceae bacterium]|nr:hypothetical protein [Isosphaeraceae bacterium]